MTAILCNLEPGDKGQNNESSFRDLHCRGESGGLRRVKAKRSGTGRVRQEVRARSLYCDDLPRGRQICKRAYGDYAAGVSL